MRNFKAYTQEQLQALKIENGQKYLIEYINKDYFNGDETVEKGEATAVLNTNQIYFSVRDPYGMDKLVMQVKVLGKL